MNEMKMTDIVGTLRSLVRFLERHKIKYCLAGGLAVVHYGVKRSTNDIDLFVGISSHDFGKVVPLLLKELNVTSYRETCGLLKVFIGFMEVDLIPYETQEETRALKNAVSKSVYGIRCKVIRLEDLILLKSSISSTEERHAIDVQLMIMYCRENINIKYLKEGVKALGVSPMKKVALENALGVKLT